MNRLALRDFRCFHAKQEARLAPLTFLVGENSTGKTSFLAIIRALWDVLIRNEVPDFRADPYDLGTFREIAYHRGGKEKQPATFSGEIEFPKSRRNSSSIVFEAVFREIDNSPFPAYRRWSVNGLSLVERIDEQNNRTVCVSNPEVDLEIEPRSILDYRTESRLQTPSYLLHLIEGQLPPSDLLSEESTIEKRELKILRDSLWKSLFPRRRNISVFASAPVRSRPHRTYDPTRPSRDAEGEYIPNYLANVFNRHPQDWENLKEQLEQFGSSMGLFDEISVVQLGRDKGGPFQLKVRKFGPKLKGPLRNLIDVGYGVNQVLPVITELVRSDSPTVFLLQQPEVHLHPRAQAALGTLFCQTAHRTSQLIVETHSDYLLNRVRLDIRDGKTPLKPSDVSILFFEKVGFDVKIHSLRMDGSGNIIDAPDSYRRFFLDEVEREFAF